MSNGQPFIDSLSFSEDVPLFSEEFLYERIGKDDARTVLSVVEDYDHLIRALGPAAVRDRKSVV